MNSLVVKLGGHTLDTLDPNSVVLRDLASDVIELRERGTNVIVVHGGGPQIERLLKSTRVESHFHEGLRITDEATMELVAMALGEVNVRIVAALNHAGLASVGVCGADDTVLLSSALGEPWQRAGSAPRVRTSFIESLWRASLTPVMSSVAVDVDGRLLNCNADSVAGALAGAIGASTLVLLSDVDQLRMDVDDPTSSIVSATSDQVRQLIDSGAARDGMRPKMVAALDALDGGASAVLLANGLRSHALSEALSGSIPTTEVRQ
ncbi:MAG: acetylglutamate kinase [Acidimicrobiaceae bacterium]|nr:acetylglutamate kinase [Acidimicrobiaceae bacterium]